MARLTQKEKQAISAIVDERLAGSAEDWKDASGLTLEEAKQELALACRGIEKLLTPNRPRRHTLA